MSNRELKTEEIKCLNQLITILKEPYKSILNNDLPNLKIDLSIGDCANNLRFCISNYDRPNNCGQRPLGVDGRTTDQDGEELSVIFFTDPYMRLYQIEFIRWDGLAVIKPNFDHMELWG